MSGGKHNLTVYTLDKFQNETEKPRSDGHVFKVAFLHRCNCSEESESVSGCREQRAAPAAGQSEIWRLQPETHFNRLRSCTKAWKQLLRADL